MAMTRVRPGKATRALFKPLARPHRATPRVPAQRRSAVIDWAAYIDGKRISTETVADAVRLVRDGELTGSAGRESAGFVWVGLHEPDAAELERLAQVFGLHPLAVEDAINAHQRPKLERYDDVHFFVMKTVGYVRREDARGARGAHGPSGPAGAAGPAGTRGGRAARARGREGAEIVETGEVMVFCGPDFLVTVRHGPHGDLHSVRERLEDQPEHLALGPTAALHAIADRIVDGYMCVAQAVQEAIDDVEEAVFSAELTDESRRIYQLKREVIQLKRAVGPLAGPLHTLANRRFVPTEIKEYFRDVEDHLTRVRDYVESYDELLNPILQAHMTQVTVADNKDMRKISAWGAILMVPTAIAGIYGMNFEVMPELRWRFGYPLVLGLIGLTCMFLYRGFRRSGWL